MRKKKASSSGNKYHRFCSSRINQSLLASDRTSLQCQWIDFCSDALLVSFERRLCPSVLYHLNFCLDYLSISIGIFFVFLKTFLVNTCPFYGATDTPVCDFWWCLLWVSKPESAALFALGRGVRDVCSLNWNSCTTFNDRFTENNLDSKSKGSSLYFILSKVFVLQ